jgi:16S rRNA (guanine(966)-N(2))-methyltransferase RsmD
MRISSGAIKGRKVKFTPHQKTLRPTTSKVREAIFDILGMRIEGASFLDLYAGTGAVGLEALSRGASKVVFVEADRGYAQNISKLIEMWGIAGKADIVTKKASAFIKWAEENSISFDMIFLDPPYHADEIISILSAIGELHILNQNGVVIAEHFTKKQLPDNFNRLQRVKDYKYGDTVLSVYKVS